MASVRLVYPAWESRHDELASLSSLSNSSGEAVLPGPIARWEEQISLRQSQPSFCPGSLGSPVVLPGAERISTSAAVFAVSLLCVLRHADWLDRCAFECGRHVARACARAVCSKPRSAHPLLGQQAHSFLPFVSRSILRTAGPTSAYPGHYPRRWLLRPSSPG